MNRDLCGIFSVAHYPMLLWGSPIKFAAARWDPKQPSTDIQSIDDGRTAERLLNWINKRIGSSFNLDDEKYDNEHSLRWNASDPEQIARAIYDVEEATANAFDIIVEYKMIKSNTRASLIKFFQLLVAHHPSKRCRRETAKLLVNFDDLWHSDLSSVSLDETGIPLDREALKAFQICGKEVPRGYWIFCRGSKNDTRGYSVSVPFNTTRGLALWLWRTHNKVNERLMKEEAALGTGDPGFLKIVWPPKQLCPFCYLSQSTKSSSRVQLDWDYEEVFKFLHGYYGKTLISADKDEDLNKVEKDESDDMFSPMNALAVPLGAALAIALASCAFGALACFWRTQQKNR